MHSKMRPKYKPTINGKVVDLDLLYQIVTSHGGWEKVSFSTKGSEKNGLIPSNDTVLQRKHKINFKHQIDKVNTRNEWDDLLEHFHLPRGTNGGLVIKQIYLK